jgi:hypothetical protein
MPRTIPFSESNRVQQAAWKRGYGTRLAGRDTAHPGEIVVEFLRVVDEMPEPAALGELESALERALATGRDHATVAGHGSWLETIQRPPRKTPHLATRRA